MRRLLRFPALLASLLAVALATAPAAGIALGQRHAFSQTRCTSATADADSSRSRAPDGRVSPAACEHACCSAVNTHDLGPPSDRTLTGIPDAVGCTASARPGQIHPAAAVETPQPRGPPRRA